MANLTMDYTGTLVIEECYKCHMVFAMPKDFQRRCRENGGAFHCPNGHGQVYTTTTVKKLEAQLAAAERQADAARSSAQAARDQADAAERSARAYRGHATRLRNRAAAGVCPAGCHRHFENLERHIASQHPGWKDSDAPSQ